MRPVTSGYVRIHLLAFFLTYAHLPTVFRREPVWKVTMSVRLRPTVRCSFDEPQGALRVALRELVEETQQEQLVIYALRVRKQYHTSDSLY